MIEPYCPTNQGERRRAARAIDDPPVPAGPTSALPGTLEKVEVLAARAESGLGLWHPEDDTFDRRRVEGHQI